MQKCVCWRNSAVLKQAEAEPPGPSFLFCRSWLRSTWFGYAIISTDPKTLQAQHTHTHTHAHTPTPTKYSSYYKTYQTTFKPFQRDNQNILLYTQRGNFAFDGLERKQESKNCDTWYNSHFLVRSGVFLLICCSCVLNMFYIYIYIYIYICNCWSNKLVCIWSFMNAVIWFINLCSNFFVQAWWKFPQKFP